MTVSFQRPANSWSSNKTASGAVTRSALSPTGMRIQTKLTVNRPGDQYEQEADRVADQVIRMPEPHVQRQCTCGKSSTEGECSECKRKKVDSIGSLQRAASSPIGGFSAPPIVDQVLSSPGSLLPATSRSFMESRFGEDFSHVRVHANQEANESAAAIHARAYTVGSNIVFASGESPAGDSRLLAHELVHVLQQSGTSGPRNDHEFSTKSSSVFRQESPVPPIPQELLVSVDPRLLTDHRLKERHDLITGVLQRFTASSSETAPFEEEAGRIGAELARRDALAAGRTFNDAAVDRMKNFFVENAKSAAPKDCITTLNEGMRLLLDDKSQKTGSQIDRTMTRLQASGHAGSEEVIEFIDAKGQVTTGIVRPKTLSANVWDSLLAMSGHDVGLSVFGLSIMDGYHSVTLTLDNTNPTAPQVTWSDQWSDRDGWQIFTRDSLNQEIEKLTIQWWDEKEDGKKPKTRATLWRVTSGMRLSP